MIIVWQISMIFKMSYRVFVLFTGIEPTQAPPEDSLLRCRSLLAGKDKLILPQQTSYINRQTSTDFPCLADETADDVRNSQVFRSGAVRHGIVDKILRADTGMSQDFH